MVEAGQVDAVAFYNISRLGRNVLEGLLFVAQLERRGVRILSATEHIDTSTAIGKMMLTNMLSVAQLQSDQIGESWSRTIATRADKGLHHGRPVGYRQVKSRPLQPDPIAGPIITWVFKAYARGEPIGQIARTVSDRRGLSTATVNVKRWLRNPVYLGHVTAGGEIVVYAAHPPLVDQQTWDKVQRRLARDRVAPSRHLDPTWPLVGLCFCPDGHRLQRRPTMCRGVPVDRLVCGRGATRGAGHPCPGIGEPRLAPVEAEVLRQTAEYLRLLRTDPAARARRNAQRVAAGVERQELERGLGRTRSAMTKLAKAWAVDDVPDAAYHANMVELRAAEAELVRQLDEFGQPVVTMSPRQAAGAADELLRLWPDATVAERARLVRLVVRRVVVRRPARWREPEADRVTVEF